jgi:Anaphase-promoting complex, subunit 10 (APC10)
MMTEMVGEHRSRGNLHSVSTIFHYSMPVYAYVLQIIVVANHMSGKDTHVRGLRILGPIKFVHTRCLALNCSVADMYLLAMLLQMTIPSRF